MDQKLAALNMVKINADVERLLGSLNQTVADANVPALSQEAQGLIAELRVTNKHLRDLLAPPEGMTSRANLPEVVGRLNQTMSQLEQGAGHREAGDPDDPGRAARDHGRPQRPDLDPEASVRRNLLFSNPPRESEVLK